MTVYIGSDHGGLPLKQAISDRLTAMGISVRDVGTDNAASCDYPDFAFLVAEAVASGVADRGIVICKSGIGMSIAANKVKGVRCALCLDTDMARLCREHNDANCLALGACNTDTDTALDMAEVFMTTEFAGGRHESRVQKIISYEDNNG